MPLDYRLGKYKICQGAPIRVFVKWEPMPMGTIPEGPIVARLELVEADSEVKQEYLTRETLLHGAALIEIPTLELAPGKYELELTTIDVDSYRIPQPFWILSRKEFLREARSDAAEGFLPAPPLVSTDEIVAMVEAIMNERLRVPTHPSIPVRRIISLRAASSEQVFAKPVSSSPIQWTTETVVDELNDIAIGGAASMRLQIEISKGIFALQFGAILHKPLSPMMHSSLMDYEVNELHLLNANGDLKEFAVEIQASPFSTNVGVRVQQAIESHPVLATNANDVTRPDVVRARTADYNT